jgi:hypothetical protein
MSGWVVGWDNSGAALRAFDGPEWRIKHTTNPGRRADIVVTVVGRQYAEGPAELGIIIDCPDTPIITSAEARKLGWALMAAAGAAEAFGMSLVGTGPTPRRLRAPISGSPSPCGSEAGWSAAVDSRGGCAAG